MKFNGMEPGVRVVFKRWKVKVKLWWDVGLLNFEKMLLAQLQAPQWGVGLKWTGYPNCESENNWHKTGLG